MRATATGHNRTGMAAAPREEREGLKSMNQASVIPLTGGDGAGLESVRRRYAEESENVGSIPPPPSVKGKVKSAIGTLSGESVAVFLDRLGQRLAFERNGSRLYEGLLTKHRVADGAGLLGSEAPGLADLQELHDEEVAHFALLHDAIEQLGGDGELGGESVCPEGHNSCLRAIAPETVVVAARELISAAGRDRGEPPAPQ